MKTLLVKLTAEVIDPFGEGTLPLVAFDYATTVDIDDDVRPERYSQAVEYALELGAPVSTWAKR